MVKEIWGPGQEDTVCGGCGLWSVEEVVEEAELWLVKEGGARPALGMFCGAAGQWRSVRGEQVYLGFLPLALDLASHASGGIVPSWLFVMHERFCALFILYLQAF